MADHSFGLRTANISAGARQSYFSFNLGGTAFFFACVVKQTDDDALTGALPAAIYEAERRDLRRKPSSLQPDAAERVEISARSGGSATIAKIRDRSYDGLGVSVPSADVYEPGDEVLVRFLDGNDAGGIAFAKIRYRELTADEDGWVRLGMSVSTTPSNGPIPVETRESILAGGVTARAWRRIVLTSARAQVAPRNLVQRVRGPRPLVKTNVVTYRNDRGQKIVGIMDGASVGGGGTAVLIPPSWGRTKETFLPLARTIVKTFEEAGEAVSVLRFDGTNRRGESYIDPEVRRPGEEYLRFTFSQAVADIRASASFLKSTLNPRNIVLVTFSLASVEGRRALAADAEGVLSGWISVVGMVDLQSGLRAVSGGVDYAYGLLEGVSFGRHELVGVLSDMDHTGRDALDHQLVFLEDARRDMSKVTVPVTWLHGRHDAWMDLDRVVNLLSAGDTSARRLIEIPTGHELRSSREAVETFQLISREIGRISLGRELKASIPDLADVTRRREAERARIPKVDFRAHSFWRDYVLGREGRGGIRLLTATDAYRTLLETQVELLDLKTGSRVVDLGSGTGELARALGRMDSGSRVQIVEVDIVGDALRQSREMNGSQRNIAVLSVGADLDLREGSLPFASASADRILASLLLSYLESPGAVLAEAKRVLRPGGVIVASSLRRDADISKIYATGIAELPADRVQQIFGDDVAQQFEVLQREFLNSASRLLDLEETGRFRFFDGDELAALLHDAGFEQAVTKLAFGDPPQACVVSARRPV